MCVCMIIGYTNTHTHAYIQPALSIQCYLYVFVSRSDCMVLHNYTVFFKS